MKSMLQFFAAAACVAALTACGGGAKTTPAVVTPQPDYKLTNTVTGSGDTAAAGDTVTFHYVGYLYDSTKSDNGYRGAKVESSVDAGVPYTGTVGVGALPAKQPATGWDQALLGMQPGGKRTAILPSTLAYGPYAQTAQTINGVTLAAVPANSPMVYDFQMINVSKAVIIPNEAPPAVVTTNDVNFGTGATVTTGQVVSVRYSGWLYDGTRSNRKGAKFDDNMQSGNALLSVNTGGASGGTSVIAGFSTGMIGMKVGGTRTVIIPPDQGYGATAQAAGKYGIAIPANSTLVFDITVISIP